MEIKKCDVCKKVMKSEYIGLSYSNKEKERSVYTRHEICGKCGKSIVAFLKKHGWTDREKTNFEKRLEELKLKIAH